MLRWLYIQLMWAHPGEFRHRFCDDMLEIFDLTPQFGKRLLLLLDAALSVPRQWFLRTEFHEPLPVANTPGAPYDLLTFRQIEPYKPSRFALAQGGLLAVLVIFGVVNAIGWGGGKVRNIIIGMHRPGFGLIKVSRESMEAGKLNTTVQPGFVKEDPFLPFARSYFRILKVLPALDLDGDYALSPLEMARAPESLLRLDTNRDGKLSPEECGFLPGDANLDPELVARYRRDFMREHPVLAALDADNDGEISASEIANAGASLAAHRSPGANGGTSEFLPYPAIAMAASMMSRYDVNDDGLIAFDEPPKEESASLQPLLRTADRNRDGVVTRGELVVHLAIPDGLRYALERANQHTR